MQVQAVQAAQKTAKELRSKFEVGHTNMVHARNRSDKNRWKEKQRFEAKQCPQDMQERTDLTNQRQFPPLKAYRKQSRYRGCSTLTRWRTSPVDVPRQGSTIQASQHNTQRIDEVEDVPAPMGSEVPTIPDDPRLDETADEDPLEEASHASRSSLRKSRRFVKFLSETRDASRT